MELGQEENWIGPQARGWGLALSTLYSVPAPQTGQRILNLNLTSQVVMQEYFSRQKSRTYFISQLSLNLFISLDRWNISLYLYSCPEPCKCGRVFSRSPTPIGSLPDKFGSRNLHDTRGNLEHWVKYNFFSTEVLKFKFFILYFGLPCLVKENEVYRISTWELWSDSFLPFSVSHMAPLPLFSDLQALEQHFYWIVFQYSVGQWEPCWEAIRISWQGHFPAAKLLQGNRGPGPAQMERPCWRHLSLGANRPFPFSAGGQSEVGRLFPFMVSYKLEHLHLLCFQQTLIALACPETLRPQI